MKNLHDEKTLEFKGAMPVSRPYPFPYGFVMDTSADDGDNVDCFVLTGTQLSRRDVVECDPMALMEQIEDDQIDHKILGVIRGEDQMLDVDVRQTLVEFATHVFDHVPGKKMQIGEFLDRQAAAEFLEQHSYAS